MTTPARLSALALIALTAAVAGCRNSVNAVGPANPEAKPNSIAMSHLKTDPSLGDDLVPISYNVGETPGGHHVAQLMVQNDSRSRIRVNYRVTWTDKAGIVVNDSPVTHALVIEPGATQAVQAVSPTPNATDANFAFQESVNN